MKESNRVQLARLRQQLIESYDRSKRTLKRRERRRRAKQSDTPPPADAGRGPTT